ncbi:hypothetical protein IFM89_004054, partial [Coptis chinensis]
ATDERFVSRTCRIVESSMRYVGLSMGAMKVKVNLPIYILAAHFDAVARCQVYILLKAGNAYHKYRVKRNCWPKVRGVAMNHVEHPHGGGNHQHIVHASTVRRDAPPGQKVGLIATRDRSRLHDQSFATLRVKRRLRYYAFVLNFFFGSDLCQTFVIHILRKKKGAGIQELRF